MKKIAVFASGSGTNFEAIYNSIENKTLIAKIEILICDKENAYVNERARKFNIPTFIFNPKDYNSKEEFEQKIVSILEEKNIDLIVLAGYMRLVGKVLLDRYEGQIINIHPSLLPSYTGKGAIKKAYDNNEKIMGITVHYVDSGMDTGKIIVQKSIEVLENESLESVEDRLHKIEHDLYPITIQNLLYKGE